MMTELTLEVRAERAARRRNKIIAEKYPLFADQLAVSKESQVVRLIDQEEKNYKFFERLTISFELAWQRGLFLREIASRYLPEDEFECFEYRFLHIFGKRRWQDSGHYLCDWWWCALRDMDVAWCWDNCPNINFHNEIWARNSGECPTCHKPLDAVEIIAGISQLGFIVEKL